jgi:hypothetical protein
MIVTTGVFRLSACSLLESGLTSSGVVREGFPNKPIQCVTIAMKPPVDAHDLVPAGQRVADITSRKMFFATSIRAD